MIFIGDVMKKKVIIICSICLIILVGGLILDKIISKSYFTEIKSKEVIEKINNKESFVLVISQTTCSHCAEYKPRIEKVANDKKIQIYFMESDLLSDDEKKEFSKYITFDGTPVTVFIKNGEEKTAATRINGSASTEKILAKLKSNGFID